ncbi:hypothetical protein ACFPM0_30640 [Pseudonocardia sulfidoxydans]|uniref:hypothetical protein n=1 Tax=Pseudonocardia sulfidoxydans TaxID=54011 RepID=UPI00361D31C4
MTHPDAPQPSPARPGPTRPARRNTTRHTRACPGLAHPGRGRHGTDPTQLAPLTRSTPNPVIAICGA